MRPFVLPRFSAPWLFAGLVCVGVLVGGHQSARADILPIAVDAGWSDTNDKPPAFTWTGGDGAFADDSYSFSSETPTIVRIADAFCRGDEFRIFDGETALGNTSAVATEEGCTGVEDPNVSFADPLFSSGSFVLGPGTHLIRIQAIESPFNGGQAYIRVDSCCFTNPDTYTTSEDTPLAVAAPGVLGNDVGSGLTAQLVAVAGPGSVTLNPDGSFTYTPPTNFQGSASFTYKATKAGFLTNVATVTVTVTSVNDAPVAHPDSHLMNAGETLSVPAPGVLANDTDADGDTLNARLVSDPAHAAAFELNPDGSFSYTPEEGFSGTDMFTYRANDGIEGEGGVDSNLVAVTITVNGPGNQTAAVTSFSPRACDVSLRVTFEALDENSYAVRPTDFFKHWHCRLFLITEAGEVEIDPLSVHGPPGITINFANPTAGDLELIPTGDTKSFEARGNLCSLFPQLKDGNYRADCTSASLLADPSERDATGQCVDPNDAGCLDAPLRAYVEAAPSFTFGVSGGQLTGDECPQLNGNAGGSGCPFAVSVRVILNGSPLVGHTVRVFDRNHRNFQEVTGGDKNPPKSLHGKIYEANQGAVGACVTDAAGRCTAGLAFSFDALAIVRFTNPKTGAFDYEGSPFGPPSYGPTGVVTKDMPIKR